MSICNYSRAGLWLLSGTLAWAETEGSFQKTAGPVLEQHCIGCHGPDKQKGEVRFDRFDGDPAAETGLWQKVLEQIHTGQMPPAKKKVRPTGAEVATLSAWIETHAPQAATAFQAKMQRPENGNLVPHDKLFDPKVAAQAPKIAASPARVWRTLPQSYEQKQEAWLKARGVGVAMKVGQDKKYGYLPAPFGLHTKAELKNYSFRYSLAGSQTEGLANNARSLLDLVIKANPRGRPNTEGNPIRACLQVFLEPEGFTWRKVRYTALSG